MALIAPGRFEAASWSMALETPLKQLCRVSMSRPWVCAELSSWPTWVVAWASSWRVVATDATERVVLSGGRREVVALAGQMAPGVGQLDPGGVQLVLGVGHGQSPREVEGGRPHHEHGADHDGDAPTPPAAVSHRRPPRSDNQPRRPAR